MIEVFLNCVFFVTHVKITLFTNFDVDWIRIADLTYVSNLKNSAVTEGETPHKFTWSDYMEAALSKAAPDCCFKHVSMHD